MITVGDSELFVTCDNKLQFHGNYCNDNWKIQLCLLIRLQMLIPKAQNDCNGNPLILWNLMEILSKLFQFHCSPSCLSIVKLLTQSERCLRDYQQLFFYYSPESLKVYRNQKLNHIYIANSNLA